MAERVRWRKVRRADGYKVSSLGQVRGPGGPLTPFPDRDGYLRVNLRGEQVLVHHLVLEAFAGPRPYGMEACHHPELSLGRHDCRAVVLRWDTDGENGRDKLRARKARSELGQSPYLGHAPETGVPC
jgi:hypothetical protein